MNAPDKAVLALIKALRPAIRQVVRHDARQGRPPQRMPLARSQHDKVALACHAVPAINGLKLVAVGPQADAADPPGPSAAEVDIDGWNDTPGEYAFRYTLDPEPSPSSASSPPAQPGPGCASLLLKCLPVDGLLFVTLAATRSDGTQLPPETLELDVARYAVPEGGGTDAALSSGQYGHLQELVKKVHEAVESQLASAGALPASTPSKAPQSLKAPAQPAATQQGGEERGVYNPAGRNPLLADDDYDDLMPGGLIDPMHMRGPRPGTLPYGPTGGPLGGGMHVGPSHPMFAGRVRHPPGGLPGGPGFPSHPGGARWDPINPEGLPGFNPDDFQRGQPRPGRGGPPVHPDMMQPGAGRGADWDHMFG